MLLAIHRRIQLEDEQLGVGRAKAADLSHKVAGIAGERADIASPLTIDRADDATGRERVAIGREHPLVAGGCRRLIGAVVPQAGSRGRRTQGHDRSQ